MQMLVKHETLNRSPLCCKDGLAWAVCAQLLTCGFDNFSTMATNTDNLCVLRYICTLKFES